MAVRARPVTWLLLGALILWGIALAAERQGTVGPLEGLAQDVLNPVQGVTVGLTRPVQESLTGLVHFRELAQENEAQRRQIALLESEVARLQEYQYENEQLRKDLAFKNRHPDLELIRARIISEDPSNYVNSILIDEGQSAGLVPGMVVVSGAGLVGRVDSVTDESAKVLLAVDPTTSIYATVQRQGARASGVVEGLGPTQMVMKFVNQTADLEPGDVVVTSGRGGTYPGGIQIGEIVSVQGNDVAPFQQAEVRPIVDARQLETVLVVANFLPTDPAE